MISATRKISIVNHSERFVISLRDTLAVTLGRLHIASHTSPVTSNNLLEEGRR